MTMRGWSSAWDGFAGISTPGVPSSLVRMAKFAIVLEDWMQSLDIQASALQCWNSLQQNLGANVCTVMSMMSEQLMAERGEVDVTGVVSDVCAATGLRHAECARRLEQQLRR